MSEDLPFSPKEFGASFKHFMDKVASQAPDEEPALRKRIRGHLDGEPSAMSIVSESFGSSDHANVHLAIESYLGQGGREHELVGILQIHDHFAVTLAQLVSPGGRSSFREAAGGEGPVQYENLPVGGEKMLACVKRGLFLIREGNLRLVVLLNTSEGHMRHGGVDIEAMGTTREHAEAFMAWIRGEKRRRSVYRGRVVSLAEDYYGNTKVQFHELPQVPREDIILPAGLLEKIERLTVDFSRHAPRLAASGRHLKRGLLLHGPPGTGKTFTAMHLAKRMTDRTVLLLTGRGLGSIASSTAMARSLQPATLILEDVDLVAEERSRPNAGCNTVLFELLNHMDGLADDADILFLLTTNRPDILEPALAARPGRIDQAFEIPLPDSECRQRLFSLYGKGLDLRLEHPGNVIDRTDGASPAFIRELLRKAALIAADEAKADAIVVQDRHVDEALHELVAQGGQLTRSLLGFRTPKR